MLKYYCTIHTNVRIYLAMDSCTVNNLMKLWHIHVSKLLLFNAYWYILNEGIICVQFLVSRVYHVHIYLDASVSIFTLKSLTQQYENKEEKNNT